jgi:hypothetical protein
MKVLRDASATELDEVFRQATVAAAEKAINARRSIVGTDQDGRLVRAYGPEAIDEPPGGAVPKKRTNAVA